LHKVKSLGFNPGKLKGISKKQITIHHDKHYASYVKGGESHNASGMKLHEVYFGHLGGKGGKPSGALMNIK